jgi:hypothetical protein
MAMIGALSNIMIRAMAPALHSNTPWIRETSTINQLPTVIPATRDMQKDRSSHNSNVNLSRSISQTHFAPSANRTVSRNGSTQEPLRLVSRRSLNQCRMFQIDSLDHRGLA